MPEPSNARESRQRQIEMATKQREEETNPCIKEQEMSFKCLNDNGYDREKCSKQFFNYKQCRKFWSNVIRLRAKQGVHPHLPPPEEREVIKQKHAQHLKELQFGKTNE